MLDRQIHCYSVDTGHFYSGHERRLHERNRQFRSERSYLAGRATQLEAELEACKRVQELVEQRSPVIDEIRGLSGQLESQDLSDEFKAQARAQQAELLRRYGLSLEAVESGDVAGVVSSVQDKLDRIVELRLRKTAGANRTKEQLKRLIANRVEQNIISGGKHHQRELREDSLSFRNIVSVFESNLNRVIGAKTDQLTYDLVTVQIYYFDLFKDLEYFGFMFRGERYIYFSSSAGQIRTKKAVFIREAVWNQHQQTIMCGLTIDKINECGGSNVNKLLAYLALQNSATDIWEDFDIDKSIVIDDFETDVDGEFDYINDVTYEISRIKGKATITHTDGAGMMLPKFGNNRMVRAPWIKGLLGVFDFVKFIKLHNCSPILTDIYGKQHDVIAEGIEVIFTKSQFKMWKYYRDWEQYKEYYHRFGCTTGYCNLERDLITNNQVTYQMLQSITDILPEEFDIMVSRSNEKLKGLSSNRKAMLAAFGVTPYSQHLTPFQEALKIYPELLNDDYSKYALRNLKDSLLNEYRSGKLEVRGKYTFVLPDLYAACEHWFLGVQNPDGLLRDGEVYTRLFCYDERLDCLRSPHLYQEHAVRYNLAYRGGGERMELCKEWFQTNAIYTSCKDMISRILQFDCDGDTLLVVADENFVRVADRNMNGIVPLYYEMKKASATEVNKKTIFDGLISAFHHSNIGIYSNAISKIKNSPEFLGENHSEALSVVALLTAENNFCIDAAKTLYMPERPRNIAKLISKYTSEKLPAFFRFAKSKNDNQVAKRNNSLVNRLYEAINNPRINTRHAGLGHLDWKKLVRDPEIEIDKAVIERYRELAAVYGSNLKNDKSNSNYLAEYVFNEMTAFGYDKWQLSDMLVKEFFGREHSVKKEVLWKVFGDTIVENLKLNVPRYEERRIERCQDCMELFEVESGESTTRCPDCQREYKKFQNSITYANQRLKNVMKGHMIDLKTLEHFSQDASKKA